MQVTVTQEHIQRGIPCNGDHCALNIALTEQTGRKWFVSTVDAELLEGEGSEPNFFTLPENAQEFAVRFDKGQPVAPFVFELPYNPLRLEKAASLFEETL